ncbi:MAG: alpha-glucuronidase [Bacteroidaceae bacterium]|nr:alpha-glucuronidase [Bacteroidaceae bacterium]
MNKNLAFRRFFPLFFCLFFVTAYAEDGSRLWLRYESDGQANISGTFGVARDELQTNWNGGPVVLKRQKGMPKDGYKIVSDGEQIRISASTDAGLLYGAYHLLRLQGMGNVGKSLNIEESPMYEWRILDHWDNPDGTIERGFAGHSIFWENPCEFVIRQYARANASVGINGAVLNNVNAKPQTLDSDNLKQVQWIADILRPYGIRVYLSVNFASPIRLGGLTTADPLDKDVAGWWKQKVDEIYRLIPDFGGFLVKANSEGEPGPCDYGRTHAEGANMLARALKPHKGIVMWRTFVYAPNDPDRAKQAYKEFQPLDGQFLDNVILQVKNGPIDFQPREPYSPLFTSLKSTLVMAELQVTQEYLGAANHLTFLAPMWQEFFSLVKPASLKAIAGVANVGDNINWCGHHFAQANWYTFGRLAWNPNLTAETIAREWLAQTFTTDKRFVNPMTDMMVSSYETVVSYMMPLGLHHQFAGGHHYGPEPWYTAPGIRSDWTPAYYHRADSLGLGFDRSSRGTDAVSQYPDELRDQYDDIRTCPEKYLTWFHHVPWDYRMHNGRTFWDELCHKYDEGVHGARRMLAIWDSMMPYVDKERFAEVQRKLRIQARDSEWWRDACLLYFQTFSKRPIPQDVEHPVHNLDEMMKFRIHITNYENPECGYSK